VNQDQVKQQLLQLREDVEEFSVIFSGKTSKKANGLYYPDTREIIIHNRNFEDDNALLYTAIHEFAHHVHFTSSPVPVGNRSHTIAFRRILHELLDTAEQLGLYKSVFEQVPELSQLAQHIRNDFLARNGAIMKELGGLLVQAEQLCEKHHARFEDFLERVLSMDRRAATSIMKMHSLDVDPSLGYENMRTVVGIRDPETRQQAQEAFSEGKSPDWVKTMARGDQQEEEDPVKSLTKEKRRIERTITSLQEKLRNVEDRLERLESYGSE
jgi:uncharacterized coiled-coil protein SlyX